ncbi:MAG: Lrp/AsnC family transcriptional regulator [Sneathiella sp.]|nr:Lrp/AsnC family transcriptional regulator [Sneathiella sp.]
MSKLLDGLDNIDRKLLNILQKNTRLSADILAHEVGTSRSSVQRRINKFRDTGLIEAEIAILSPDLMNRKILAIVEVTLLRYRSDLLDDFRRMANSHDEVQQCYYLTGKTAFIVIISADDLKSYEQFTRRIFADNPNVDQYQSRIVADRYKVGLQIPVI